VLKKKIVAFRGIKSEKRSIEKLGRSELDGKRVLVRVDFNVPLRAKQISDDTRIKEALPTIKHLLSNGAKVILVSHLGRPDGAVKPELKMGVVRKRLAELVRESMNREVSVKKLDDWSGAQSEIAKMPPSSIVLLENIRFDPRETANDPVLAKELAYLAEIYVNDAFGTAHRAHASTEGVAYLLPTYAGILMTREIDNLNRLIATPREPFVAIIGGAKVSSKIGVLTALLGNVDTLIIAGRMSLILSRAQGLGGGILDDIEAKEIAAAKKFLAAEKLSSTTVVFPVDNRVVKNVIRAGKKPADRFKPDSAGIYHFETVSSEGIDDEAEGVDIGPETITKFEGIISGAGKILWNGPVGAFEVGTFAAGTEAIARAVAESEAVAVVGGGDSIAALSQVGLLDQFKSDFKCVSTGGGAMLEYVEMRCRNKELPGIAAIPSR
jgi:phosphoglycerate kinase